MGVRETRKPGVLDVIIGVAAMAVGIVFTRMFGSYRLSVLLTPADSGWIRAAQLELVLQLVSQWLAVSTLCLLAFRLRSPRPSLRRLSRRPGFVASVAAGSVIVWGSALCVSIMAMTAVPTEEGFYIKYVPTCLDPVGAAVGAGWLVQAWGGRWRPEPGWLDRAGRVLGASWILVFLAHTSLSLWEWTALIAILVP
jgi:hypothetical protein